MSTTGGVALVPGSALGVLELVLRRGGMVGCMQRGDLQGRRRCSLHGNNASIRKLVIKQSLDFDLLSGAKRFASEPHEKDRIEQPKPFKPIKFPRTAHGGPWRAKTDALEPLSRLQTTTKPGAGVPTTPRNMADPSSDGVAICSGRCPGAANVAAARRWGPLRLSSLASHYFRLAVCLFGSTTVHIW